MTKAGGPLRGAAVKSGWARRWCWAVATWSFIFAAPHFFWALGGRAGLGTQSAAADQALAQPWFASYNALAGVLGVGGALLALGLGSRRGPRSVRRWLLAAAVLAGLALLLRGVLGVTLLVLDVLGGGLDRQIPALLLAIEPWFVIGGVANLGMAAALHRRGLCA